MAIPAVRGRLKSQGVGRVSVTCGSGDCIATAGEERPPPQLCSGKRPQAATLGGFERLSQLGGSTAPPGRDPTQTHGQRALTFPLTCCLGHYLALSHRKPTTLYVFPPHQPQGDLRESRSPSGVRRLGHGPGCATMSCVILGDSLGSSAFCVLIYTMMGWTRRSLSGFKLQNVLTPRHRWTLCHRCPGFQYPSLGFALFLEKGVAMSNVPCLLPEN